MPEEVAIIGAENDELLCEMAHPTISSIATPAERIGYEAAAMLDRLVNKEPAPKGPLLLPATGVITRQSTNVLVGIDPDISDAVRFIREHVAEPIVIEDVLRNVLISRRSFERKFRSALGRSPAQEIRRMRIAIAKTLLSSGARIKTETIAKRCGFSSTAQFCTAFHQTTGMTPTDYRRTMGQKNSPASSSTGSSVTALPTSRAKSK